MRRLAPKSHFHNDHFSPGVFFTLVVLITLAFGAIVSVSLQRFGAEAFLLENRAAIWLVSILVGLFGSSFAFDHIKRLR